MDIEFDPAKDRTNHDKHGVSLVWGIRLFDDPAHLILPSVRPVDGEAGFKVIGQVDDRLWSAIFVWRGTARRFVSVRRSNAQEARAYADSD